MSFEQVLFPQPIIQEAIQKALDNGWQVREPFDGEKIVAFDVYKYGTKKVTFFTDDAVRIHVPVWEVIFNHDFAKALWGEATYHDSGSEMLVDKLGWQDHLKQMVIANDPIKYLGEHLG